MICGAVKQQLEMALFSVRVLITNGSCQNWLKHRRAGWLLHFHPLSLDLLRSTQTCCLASQRAREVGPGNFARPIPSLFFGSDVRRGLTIMAFARGISSSFCVCFESYFSSGSRFSSSLQTLGRWYPLRLRVGTWPDDSVHSVEAEQDCDDHTRPPCTPMRTSI